MTSSVPPPRVWSTSHLWADAALIWTGVAVVLAFVKIAIVAQGDSDTIKAIVSTENPVTTFGEILAPLVPLALFAAAPLALWWLAERRTVATRRLMEGDPATVRVDTFLWELLLSFVALVLSVAILPWTITLLLLGVVVYHFWTEGRERRRIVQEWRALVGPDLDDDTRVAMAKVVPQHRFVFGRVVIGIYLLVLISQILTTDAWKPTEEIVTSGKTFPRAVVLSQDDNTTTLLDLTNTNVVYVPTAQVRSQAICSGGHDRFRPGSSLASLLAHHSYPLCPRKK
jgi:hypothetical protein